MFLYMCVCVCVLYLSVCTSVCVCVCVCCICLCVHLCVSVCMRMIIGVYLVVTSLVQRQRRDRFQEYTKPVLLCAFPQHSSILNILKNNAKIYADYSQTGVNLPGCWCQVDETS